MVKYWIYGLVDPITGHLRYIGKSHSSLRPKCHARERLLRLDRNKHKVNWIRLLQRQGLMYSVVSIQEFNEPEVLVQAERFWIRYFRRLGCPLVNISDGGEGDMNKVISSEQRLKISQGLKAYFRANPVARENISIRQTGVVVSAETRKKISQRGLGRKCSVETKNKMSQFWRGRKKPWAGVNRLRARGVPEIIDNYGNTYESAMHAAAKLGLDHSSISKVLKGKLRQTHGYVFKYKRSGIGP